MKHKCIASTLFLLLALLAVSLALADTLTLRDGQSFNGTYLGGTSRTIRFRAEGVIKTFRKEEVRDISFLENAVTTSSSTSPGVAGGAYGQYPSRTYPRAAVRDEYVVPTGTVLRVRTSEAIDSDVSRVGDTFSGSLDDDLILNSELLAERGTPVKLRIAEVQQSGEFKGRSQLTIDLVEMTLRGTSYTLTTSQVQERGASRTRKSEAVIGGGAALGAIIGAIAGGAKGAVIGTVVGGAAGAGYQVLTKGDKVKIPAETVLEFTMQQPLYVRR
ncbi:MAG TPA: hypothetical protein VGQ81_09860 [Acidobacteriota bacterium]|jgi:outer membrane lipoprotein SlyB|nr:hypothetical protein [Acidobacteriota bacterium]